MTANGIKDGPALRVYIEGASPAAMGAPATGTYITQTPDISLPNAQPLSGLATGLLKSTTGTGVLSIATGADLPPAIATFAAYVPDDQSAAYTSTPVALVNAATLTDLNTLRAAYEVLRLAYDDLRTKIAASPIYTP